jgi:hypothetical protein
MAMRAFPFAVDLLEATQTSLNRFTFCVSKNIFSFYFERSITIIILCQRSNEGVFSFVGGPTRLLNLFTYICRTLASKHSTCSDLRFFLARVKTGILSLFKKV